jgi:hypothetical protein
MPPTNPDRDRNSTAPKDKDENPFIKFKRFADAQIGAVLQGIIGLPSVFSKQPNDANSRWADLHDDLKRRDRILAEQRASKESGLTHSQADSEDEEVEIPVKKFPGWSPTTSAQADSPKSSSVGNGDGMQDSIDLFSPVTKSLFAHLIHNPMDDADWSKLGLLAKKPPIFPGSCLNSVDYFDLRDDQMMGTALNMIQSIVLNNLNRTARTVGYNHLHSPQSVLPYILFSPYSPLALSSMPPPSRRSSVFEHDEDDFPYCEAFQDLLLTSQGRPMTTWVLMPPELRANKASSAANMLQNNDLGKARSGMSWIDHLHSYGLLTKEPPSNLPLRVGQMELSSPIRMKFAKPIGDKQEHAFSTSRPQRGPDTEQDSYDFLDRIVGNVSSPFPIKDAMQAIEAFIKDAVGYLAEQENNTTGNRPLYSERVSPRAAETDPNQDESDLMRRSSFTSSKSTSTQTEAFPDQVAQANATKSVESDQTEEVRSESTVPPATERVVSTTTSTKQTTDESGSVHTTVTIQKLYADGRTSITTTSKANFPPMDRQCTEEEWLALHEDERCPYCDAKHEEVEEPKRKEKKSKGWFWN